MSEMRGVLGAVTAALVLEMIAGLLWVGSAAHRIHLLESRLSALASVEIRAARLEEQTIHLRAAVARMEAKLDEALAEERRP